MALLRNREVQILGPNGSPDVSPVYTVQYPDGTREDTPLKFIEMSESEHKAWAKDNARHADIVKTIPDKEHQDILDRQNPDKIRDRVKKGELNKSDEPVKATTYVKPSEVAPQVQKDK